MGGSWFSIFDPVFCALKRFFCWAIQVVVPWIRPFVDSTLAMLPEHPPSGWAEVSFLADAFDAWMPLTEFVVVWTAGVTFSGALIVIRTVKKFIPTLAG